MKKIINSFIILSFIILGFVITYEPNNNEIYRSPIKNFGKKDLPLSCFYSQDNIYNPIKIIDPTKIPDTTRIMDSIYNVNYIRDKNFITHISGSTGISLVNFGISKIRLEFENETKTENLTYGGILHLYTLNQYYKGYKIEAFGRYYFVPNSSGEGCFIQLRAGGGQFNNIQLKDRFNTFGAGIDLGYKVLVGPEKTNYRNYFTITPLGGIQVYNDMNGHFTPTFLYQIRFGYQF